MIFFSNIAEFKAHVGNAADAGVSFDAMLPMIEEAEWRFLNHFFPYSFWEEVIAIDATTITPGDFNEARTEVLRLYSKALAWFAMYCDTELVLRKSDNGLMKHDSDTAVMGDYGDRKDTKRAYLIKGYDAVDNCIATIRRFGVDAFGSYGDSQEWLALNSTFFQGVKDFARLGSVSMTNYTYVNIYPQLVTAHKSMFEGFLPALFLEHLQTNWKNAALSKEEQELIRLINTALAQEVLKESIAHNLVQMIGNEVIVNERKSPFALADFDKAISSFNRRKNYEKERNLAAATSFAKKNKAVFQSLFSEADGGTNTDADAWDFITVDTQSATINCDNCYGSQDPFFMSNPRPCTCLNRNNSKIVSL